MAGEACAQDTRSLALSCGFVPRGVREAQPLNGGQAGEFGPAVVAAGGEQRRMAHEALDLNGVDAGVEEVRGEGPSSVVGAEVADAGLAGPAVDEGVDGLGGEAPDGDSPGLVDGQKSGPGSSRPRTSSQAAMARRPPAGRAVRRWRRPLPVTVRWPVAGS